MGKLLIIREGEHKQCMSYPEFQTKMKNKDFQQHFHHLIVLLDGIHPTEDCRWKRLEATLAALGELERVCIEPLNIQDQPT